MGKSSKRTWKIAIPALVAAGVASWLGASTARADFILNVTPGAVSGGDSSFTVSAFANSTSVTPQGSYDGGTESGTPTATSNPSSPDTSSSITGFDVVLDTPGTGTSGAMFIDTNDDIDADGVADANVVGATDQTFGMPQPSYGSTLGTYLGFAELKAGGAYRIFAVSLENGAIVKSDTVYEGSNTSTHTPILPIRTPSNYMTSDGPLDPDYVNGTVHSLELVEKLTSTANYTADLDTSGVPIANIVVPTGTPFIVTAQLDYDANGDAQEITFVSSASVPEPVSMGVILLGGWSLLSRRNRRPRSSAPATAS